MRDRKAQGLPLNTIIVAALVLIVLVVLILIFTGQMGDWIQGIGKSRKDECPDDSTMQEGPCDSETQVTVKITPNGKYCCAAKTTP